MKGLSFINGCAGETLRVLTCMAKTMRFISLQGFTARTARTARRALTLMRLPSRLSLPPAFTNGRTGTPTLFVSIRTLISSVLINRSKHPDISALTVLSPGWRTRRYSSAQRVICFPCQTASGIMGMLTSWAVSAVSFSLRALRAPAGPS